MKPLHVGLIGFGTVGRGTWDVLRRNEEEIARRAGRPIRITWIGTRSLERARHGARGMTGDNRSLSTALTKLESDAVDSDGDRVTDVEELKAGTDPNSSANGSILGNEEPGYGCGGSAPHGRNAVQGLLGVAALGWLLSRRLRVRG